MARHKHSLAKCTNIFLGKQIQDTGLHNVTIDNALFVFHEGHTPQTTEQSSFLSQNTAKIRSLVWRFLHPPSGLPLVSRDLEEYLDSCAFLKVTKRKKAHTESHEGLSDLLRRSPFASSACACTASHERGLGPEAKVTLRRCCYGQFAWGHPLPWRMRRVTPRP